MKKRVSKDECLRLLFHTLLTINQQIEGRGGACRMLAGEEVYLVNRTSVYKGAPNDDEMHLPQGKVAPLSKAVTALEVKDTTRFRPEVMLYDDCAPLQSADMSSDSVLLVVAKPPEGKAGVWSLKRDSSGQVFQLARTVELQETNHVLELPLSPMEIPGCVLEVMSSCGYSPEDFRTSLAVSRLGLIPVLLMSGETGMLWTTLSREDEQSGLWPITTPDGTVFIGDAWNPVDLAFKKLIKKRTKKMKGLGNPLTMKKPAPTPEPIEKEQPKSELAAAFDAALGEDSVVINNEVGIEAELDPRVDAQKPMDDPTEESVPVRNSEVQEPAEEPIKKMRTRKTARPAGLDLAAVVESLGAPVEFEDETQVDALLTELRDLRDLQVAAARRAANLASAFVKFSKNAIERYAQIRELLK